MSEVRHPARVEEQQLRDLLALQIHQEQRRNMVGMAPGGLLVALLVWWLFPLTGVLVWGALTLVVQLLVWLVLRQPARGDAAVAVRATTTTNVITGVWVGMLPWLAMPDTASAQSYIAVILLAGLLPNIIESSGVWSVFAAFHLPVMLLGSVAFIVRATGDGRTGAAIIAVVGALMALFASSLRNTRIEQMRLLLSNEALVEQLSNANERLAVQAQRDPLTGLANRRHFDERLSSALATRAGGRTVDTTDHGGVGVVFLDLDRFKEVNDTFGHDVGDLLLIAVCERLTAICPPGVLLARLGGDELVACLPDAESEAALIALADRLLSVFDDPFLFDGIRLPVAASAGCALSAGDMTASELMRAADVRLYDAKRTARRRTITVDAAKSDVDAADAITDPAESSAGHAAG